MHSYILCSAHQGLKKSLSWTEYQYVLNIPLQLLKQNYQKSTSNNIA